MQKSKKNHKKHKDLANRGQNTAKGALRSANFRSQTPSKSKGMKSHGPKGQFQRRSAHRPSADKFIWGLHAVKAALINPKRQIHHLYMTENSAKRLDICWNEAPRKIPAKILTMSEIDALLPEGASHQGAAVKCAPLPDSDMDEICLPAQGLIVVLDQITDPHNVGAMFRLAKAFGARGIVMQNRGAPPLMGATAKVAVGTLETVPHVLVTNIANTLLYLQKNGWRVTGLAGETELPLAQALQSPYAEVIVMGAEGPGLRPRVRKCCDQLARIPMPGGAESLNVATAAAIALYEATRT